MFPSGGRGRTPTSHGVCSQSRTFSLSNFFRCDTSESSSDFGSPSPAPRCLRLLCMTSFGSSASSGSLFVSKIRKLCCKCSLFVSCAFQRRISVLNRNLDFPWPFRLTVYLSLCENVCFSRGVFLVQNATCPSL